MRRLSSKIWKLTAVLATASAMGFPAASAAAPIRSPPSSAAQRVIYRLELIHTGKLSADILEKLRPLQTLDEVEGVLKANDIGFAWVKQDVDSATAQPALRNALESVPASEVFVVLQAQRVIIGRIVERRTP
jgi:hypothetical protein